MMICWDCYWGWPKAVADIYDRAEKELNDLGYDGERALDGGPGHVVWADENFDFAGWCLEHFDEHSDDMDPEVQVIVRRSLQELRDLPNDQKYAEPENYDGEHPENYPPLPGFIMVKR